MTVTDFLLPVFVLVLLKLVLHVFMARERIRSLLSGEVKREDVSLNEPNWTKRATQFSNCYNNQFELPMLFYILVAFLLITQKGDIILLTLAWIFVLSRLGHAYVYTTNNIIDLRFKVYAIGLLALLLMWLLFAIKILTGA